MTFVNNKSLESLGPETTDVSLSLSHDHLSPKDPWTFPTWSIKCIPYVLPLSLWESYSLIQASAQCLPTLSPTPPLLPHITKQPLEKATQELLLFFDTYFKKKHQKQNTASVTSLAPPATFCSWTLLQTTLTHFLINHSLQGGAATQNS